MALITLDVVLVMPPILREQAITCSKLLSRQMRERGSDSYFQLGEPFPGEGGGGDCEPHVSLFMLTVDENEVSEVMRAVERLARAQSALDAEGLVYRHNPYGALEIHFARSAAWRALQRVVIASVEPLRRGRLRDVDPSGTSIRDLIKAAPQDDVRRQQLLKYGYDEVFEESDKGRDLFSPHVTLTWPRDPNSRVGAEDLPRADLFSAPLNELAVYGMSAYGTCTREYGVYSLDEIRPVSALSITSYRESIAN
jgi:hypothetical protein